MGEIANESYLLSKKIIAASDGGIVGEIYDLMMKTSDESVIRKCLSFYIAIGCSGVSMNSVLTSLELQKFKDKQQSRLNIKGEQLLVKLETLYSKGNAPKKTMTTNEESMDWDIINKVRRATKGCLTILKNKINS